MRSSAEIDALMAKSVTPSSMSPDGLYTLPRSWGAYEVSPPQRARATRRFRMGNHPVRQRELAAEFGDVRVVAVYTSRTLAESLAALLNGRT